MKTIEDALWTDIFKMDIVELIKLIDNALKYMTMYSQAKDRLKLIDRNIEMIKN